MNRLIFASVASIALSGCVLAQDGKAYSPASDAGSCFAGVLIPETTEIVTEQVIDEPERTEVRFIPAVLETFTQEVLVTQATKAYKVIPAKFITQTEQILEEPERIETSIIPARFETYTETVLVRPAYTTWKPGAGISGREILDGGEAAEPPESTGERLSRVEVPAQFEDVTRTRIVTPERVETKVIPARYRTISRKVVASPAQVVEEDVPAVYETITLRRVVTPAQEETIVIPATYRTVETREVTGGGNLESREVLCDTNASPAKIKEVQEALNQKGYPAPADGVFGPATRQAMEDYQRANGLPVGHLPVSTLESLGVSVNQAD
jgi:hypothetical protein